MKNIFKIAAQWFSVVVMLPFAILCAFGRISVLFTIFAHICAQIPGILGDYARTAFYWMTLRECAIDARISFGTFFAHREVSVESKVYIGSYCILGRTRIGARTQVASHVQILSGRRQHSRDEAGKISGVDQDALVEVAIGADCWIGAGAIVMADIGEGTTIGAGAIVTNPIPAGSVAVGNPARVKRQL
ncbi:MAG: acyltransferase [Candidatus Acidiferrales bacterium]